MKFLAGRTMIIFSILAISTTMYAQTNQSRLQTSSPKPVSKEMTAIAAELSDARNDVISAAIDYKASLEKLLALQQDDVKRAAEEVEKRKNLLGLEIITRREVEQSEQALAQAQAKVEETKSQMGDADALVAEVRAAEDPMESARRLLAQRKKRERTPRGRVYYVAFVIVGEIIIYDYSGAINGQLIKFKNQIKYDSRRSR